MVGGDPLFYLNFGPVRRLRHRQVLLVRRRQAFSRPTHLEVSLQFTVTSSSKFFVSHLTPLQVQTEVRFGYYSRRSEGCPPAPSHSHNHLTLRTCQKGSLSAIDSEVLRVSESRFLLWSSHHSVSQDPLCISATQKVGPLMCLAASVQPLGSVRSRATE
jgi:hypothetical protein